MSRGTSALAMLAATALLVSPPAVTAQNVAPDQYAQLHYRYIGPVGNRVSAVAGVPGEPNIYYAGAASGGIFKTTDGGIHWQPIFDDEPVLSIGALAVAPSDPNVVWAGTGEPFIRSHISVGWGVYKSTDGGAHWALMGLENTGRIARIAIDPADANVVLVCAEGHAYGPQPDRGVFRTSDGGVTWRKTLFVDENTGCSDLAMDPTNPRILFAGTWQIEIHTWGRTSGGPGSGLWTSRDEGRTWTRLTGHGLPSKPVGKVAVAIAPSNSDRIYALIETGDGVPLNGQPTESGELWRSDDGGKQWALVSYDRQLAGRTHYYSRVVVNPDDRDEAYFLSGSFSKTLDGGATTVDVGYPGTPGGDNHDMWIDPNDGNRMVVGNDGVVAMSMNRGETWNRVQLPIAQMYHVTVDNRVPYYVYGNRQDGPSYRGPSNSRAGGYGGAAIVRGNWHSVCGGESGWATPDPVDPDIIWSSASGSGAVGGIVVRFDERTRMCRNVEVWPLSTIGWPAADLKYRFVWTPPLTISPHDHNVIYTGSQYVHRTTDGGQSWQVISPDLTLNDKSRQQMSGGLTGDNIGVEYAGVVFAIAESPVTAGLIWAGTNDGLVQVTQDGGGTWTNVTKNIPNLPPWGTVSNIEPSRYDASTAYLTVDFHQMNGRDPYVYKTTDLGKSWKLIVNGIPKSPLSYAHVVREDPVRRGMLYLGTENALYVSFDDGGNWQPLQTNLPHAPVYWLTVQEQFHDLVVATYGRGFWILDDITPLEQLTPEIAARAVHLFEPRDAYRFRAIQGPVGSFEDPTAGVNPPYGASITYWLKSVPAGDVKLVILDAAGDTVRTLQATKDTGLNRVWWNLRGEPTAQATIHMKPLYADWVKVPPEGLPAPSVGRISRLEPPGTYTVKLIVGDDAHTQPLVVLKDPHSAGSEADIRAQDAFVRALQSDLNAAVDLINQLELMRSQIASLTLVLQGDQSAADVRAAADSLGHKLTAVEGKLHQLKITGRGQDVIRWPAMLSEKIAYLAGGIAGADFAPTSQQLQVKELLEQDLTGVQHEFQQVVSTDVAAFNTLLERRGIAGVVVRKP